MYILLMLIITQWDVPISNRNIIILMILKLITTHTYYITLHYTARSSFSTMAAHETSNDYLYEIFGLFIRIIYVIMVSKYLGKIKKLKVRVSAPHSVSRVS